MHDFNCFKKSRKRAYKKLKFIADSAYIGIQKFAKNSITPYKSSKKSPLDQEKIDFNKQLSSQRVLIEHVISFFKKFKILSTAFRGAEKQLRSTFLTIAFLR